MVDWYIGTMGFGYKPWVGPFYPAGLQPRRYLSYYAERFNAVEMDSTFYGTPSETAVSRWAHVTPPHFKICPKVPRQITHDLRLLNADELMTTFLARMRLLGDKLGPIVIQFPPDFGAYGMDVFTQFISQLPTDLRFAVEFRHRSWMQEKTAALLRDHNLCWIATDYIHLPKTITRTADFLYLRFIGPHGQFTSKDREILDKTTDLQRWQRQIQPHLAHIDAFYGFINNDYAGYSPATCNRLKDVLGVEREEIRPLQQGRLF